MTASSTAAGWYPNPDGTSGQRYWDGTSWTQQQPSAAPKENQGLVWAGYIFAVLMPIVGFFLGLALIIRGRNGHGVACMVLSVLTVVVVASVLVGAAATDVADYSDCLDKAQTLAQMDACE